ncbi:hypothetical protein WJX81_008302 [Elliptochloris bilobata]|uniref:RING-type E3 ubiquitin transferase n=1 Tax=Elliptochloris bilobata TaxID=381761 RepID=A0AAW1S5G1_9CHLO
MYVARRAEDAEQAAEPSQAPSSAPASVSLDRATAVGELRIAGSIAESWSNFGSARANAAVTHGKWQYEAHLGTAGIQQLGYVTVAAAFTSEEGVGDCPDSYAFDGHRVRKWNVTCTPYGEAWTAGDVIGCALDLDAGVMSFTRNGRDMGQAFTNIRRPLAYYPGISLGYGERCELNFGERPFAHPLPGYRPLVASPAGRAAAAWLLACLRRLVLLLVSGAEDAVEAQALREAGVAERLASPLAARLAPLLASEHQCEGVLLPWLLELQDAKPGRDPSPGPEEADPGAGAPAPSPALQLAVQLLSQPLAMQRVQPCWQALLPVLARCVRAAPLLGPKCRATAPALLALAVGLIRLPLVRERWLSTPGWRDAYEGLMTLHQPTPRDLEVLIPAVQWMGAAACKPETPAGSGPDKASAAHNPRHVVRENEGAYRGACAALAAAAAAVEERHLELCAVLAATPTLLTGVPSEPSTRLSQFVAHLLRKNRGALRAMPPPGLSDPLALRSAFVALTRLLRPALEGAHGPLPPFPAGSHFLTGLAKRGLDRYGGAPRLGGELAHLEKTAELARAKQALQAAQGAGAQLAARHTERLCSAEAAAATRAAAWAGAALGGARCAGAHLALLLYLARLLAAAGHQAALFPYVPELYVGSLVDGFHAAAAAQALTLPGVPPPERPGLLLAAATRAAVAFVARRFADAAIVGPDLREVLLASLRRLLAQRRCLAMVEASAESRAGVIHGLLRSFHGRDWLAAKDLAHVLAANPALRARLLDRLFVMLNWALTELAAVSWELDGMAGERASERYAVSLARRVAGMAELAAALARLLEFLAARLPAAFLGASTAAGVNLARLAETAAFVVMQAGRALLRSLIDALEAAESSASRSRSSAVRQDSGDGQTLEGRANSGLSSGSSDDDTPEEFLDPILMTPMVDPVVLPESRAVVDRGTLARHLIASPTDPFTRTPLAARDARPLPELRARIAAWQAARHRGQ